MFTDVDECSTGQHRCYYNQRCINTEGAYRCQCPKGFRTRGIGEPCRGQCACGYLPLCGGMGGVNCVNIRLCVQACGCVVDVIVGIR